MCYPWQLSQHWIAVKAYGKRQKRRQSGNRDQAPAKKPRASRTVPVSPDKAGKPVSEKRALSPASKKPSVQQATKSTIPELAVENKPKAIKPVLSTLNSSSSPEKCLIEESGKNSSFSVKTDSDSLSGEDDAKDDSSSAKKNASYIGYEYETVSDSEDEGEANLSCSLCNINEMHHEMFNRKQLAKHTKLWHSDYVPTICNKCSYR